MMIDTLTAAIDPLHAFMQGAFVADTKRPIPLTSTRFDVSIVHGLAVVSMRRTFRNQEAASIEATITFPVPVHATLFGLEARIDGRLLKARAQRKATARATYEDAIERGKAAVLHEEVLRGVHMISVAHIAPDAEIEVSATFGITLTNLGGRASLRIPLTVGDIYGRSGLSDSDDLVSGGASQMADLNVRCRDGQVSLRGRRLGEETARIPLNRPVDLEITGWTPADLVGRAADGRDVVLRIEPDTTADQRLDIAVLIDRSGSMGEVCAFEDRTINKHQAAVAGLRAAAASVGSGDRIDLFEFDDAFGHIGSATGAAALLNLIDRLHGPNGGTEIGRALAGVAAGSTCRDILMVTDGKSHALDVQALARTGRRFSVVLVGEDSLEANAGHLAALTGGEIFVAVGADLARTIVAALQSLRGAPVATPAVNGPLEGIAASRAGMKISAQWRTAAPAADGATAEPVESRAVAAFAASLALPALAPEAAASLAEAEGLVTHLTSLVLVDEASVVQAGIPATRKIALPAPAAGGMPAMARMVHAQSAPVACPSAAAPMAADASPPPPVPGQSPGGALRKGSLSFWEILTERRPARPKVNQKKGAPEPAVDLSAIAGLMDWDANPQRLQAGDLADVDPSAASAIQRAAATADVQALAQRLGLDAVTVVIGLLARAASGQNRTASRIAKAIFGARSASTELDSAAASLGL